MNYIVQIEQDEEWITLDAKCKEEGKCPKCEQKILCLIDKSKASNYITPISSLHLVAGVNSSQCEIYSTALAQSAKFRDKIRVMNDNSTVFIGYITIIKDKAIIARDARHFMSIRAKGVSK